MIAQKVVDMAYQYDVFFSYKRDPESDHWNQTVKDKLEYWLRQEPGIGDVEIFLDTEEISTGQRWKDTIETALRTSRCAVCMWSPQYFESKWCVSEWLTFEQRGQALDADLVSPARYHDGSHYPEAAKARQAVDFSPFAYTVPHFWKSEKAFEFEDPLKKFAKNLAHIVKSAPEFREDFEVVIAEDDDVQREKQIQRISNG